MTQERIYRVIKRLSGNLTDKQRYTVWYWLFLTKDKPDTQSVIDRIWRESQQHGIDDESIEQSLKMTKERINRQDPVSPSQKKAHRGNPKSFSVVQKKHYWIAAACVTAAVISSLLFFRSSPEHSGETAAYIGQTMPSDDIRLISGANITRLNQNSHISLKEDGQVALINDNRQSEVILSKKEMNRLIVPYGKRSTLELSDGTKVWMNSGTELEFPSEFKGATREIHLKGEIYIEVAPMKGKPFYVRTFDFDVQVFGTRFNVSAYPGKAEKTVVLAEGKVEVDIPGKGKSGLLPEEMLRIDDYGMQKEKADVEKYICWKDGILIFHKTPISDVLQKIGRYYNVSFDDFSDDLLSVKTCTGKLHLSDNLDEVLMSVAVLSETIYYKEKGVIYIRNKPKLN